MRKPTNSKTRVKTRATGKDAAVNKDITKPIGAETVAETDAKTDAEMSQEPLYAFASLVAGHDRAESWLAQERARRSHIESNLPGIEAAPKSYLTQAKLTSDTSCNDQAPRFRDSDRSINEPSPPEGKKKLSTGSIVHQKNNGASSFLPAIEYLDVLGHKVDLKGHPFLHNRKSWSENCSILHSKVMELYESVGCWTKHPWNKDNCTEDAKSTIPYPFSIPFVDRPSHKAQVQGSRKPQQTCLTCINAKRGCAPGPVVGGKCIVCQGGDAMTSEAIRKGEIRYEDAYDEKGQPKRPKTGGKFCGGKQRTCYWEMPQYFINTYEVAHLFFGGRYRTNKTEQTKFNVVPKLEQTIQDSGFPLQMDDSTAPSKLDMDTLGESPGAPEPASRLTEPSSPPGIFQETSPPNAFPSPGPFIHQPSYLALSQTSLDQNLQSSDGVVNFNVSDKPSLVSDGPFPSATDFAPPITFNAKYNQTIDPRLLHSNNSAQLTQESPISIDDSVIDPALLDPDISQKISEGFEHTSNDFDIELDRLEELNGLTQSGVQEFTPPFPILTTDPKDIDTSLEVFQPSAQPEQGTEEAEATNTLFDFNAWLEQSTQSGNAL